MIDLALKLVDRCIALAKQGKEARRRLFEDFVEPTFHDFGEVHENYLTRFRKYRHLIQDKSHPMAPSHPVFAAIAEDGLFSYGLRARLHSLYSVDSNDEVKPLLRSIHNYLNLASSSPLLMGAATPEGLGQHHTPSEADKAYIIFQLRWLNQMLNYYSYYISEIVQGSSSEDKKRTLTIEALDRLVVDTQRHYHAVTEEYIRIRARLLELN